MEENCSSLLFHGQLVNIGSQIFLSFFLFFSQRNKTTDEYYIRQCWIFPGWMKEVRYNHNSRMHHTLAHTAQVVLQTTNPINAKSYAASLQFILIFFLLLFLLLFFSWVRWWFICTRNTDTFGRASHLMAYSKLDERSEIFLIFTGWHRTLEPKHFISTLSVLNWAPSPKLKWHNSSMHTDKTAIQGSAKASFSYSAYGWNHRQLTIRFFSFFNDDHSKIRNALLLHQKEHRTSSIVIITIIRYVLLLLCFLCPTANTRVITWRLTHRN